MIAILLPNSYLKNGSLNLMIFNWAPVMVILVTILALSYWFIYGRFNEFEIEEINLQN